LPEKEHSGILVDLMQANANPPTRSGQADKLYQGKNLWCRKGERKQMSDRDLQNIGKSTVPIRDQTPQEEYNPQNQRDCCDRD